MLDVSAYLRAQLGGDIVTVTANGSDSSLQSGVGSGAAPRFTFGSDIRWRRDYRSRLLISDAAVLIVVVFGAQLMWFGLGNAEIAMRNDARINDVSYTTFSILLILLWLSMLGLIDSRDHRIIGTGWTEYARVADASFRLFGLIAVVAFLTRIDLARGYLLISLPLGVALLLTERWIWRQWLARQRRDGNYSARVLLVGSPDTVAQIAGELIRSPNAGYLVVGACVPSGRVADTIPGTTIPIMGNVNAVDRAIEATQADTVAITSTDELSPTKVKEISWALQPGRQHLVLAPSLLDIAGPRIHTRPVAGLPLIHVETPKFTAGQRFVKRVFDLSVASLGVTIISPVLIIVAILVKLSGPGPILYSQERIGLAGQPFKMLKFRSMKPNADQELAALLAEQGTSTTPLFKIKHDPRITTIGRFLRKYSLDELPQFFNVLGGSMSLVGPRPQIAAEVALYSDRARRRLLARPGITGLWQVSGRSSLSWEDAVKLDLYYVENWSLLGDIGILAKTATAVMAPGDSAH